MKRPIVSIVIPVYNARIYLEQTLESLITQTIGLDSLEVILVNDGSTDGSDEVCIAYAEKYPEIFRYIAQKNAGVSRARNAGFLQTTGKYVHFFDADDIISLDFYATTIGFLDTQESVIDFAAAKIQFFDEIIDSHPLNYKFSSDKVIDLSIDHDNPILHVNTCIFRRDAIKNIQFDERLSIGEDMKFISEVLLQNRRYGVVKRPTYYYRKRTVEGSAIAGKEHNKGYYQATPKFAYQSILSEWGDSGDSRPMEYTILYDISYRLEQRTQTVLGNTEQADYLEVIKAIVSRCSDEAILLHTFLSSYKKLYILELKYGKKLDALLKTKDGVTYFENYKLIDHTSVSTHIDFLTKQKGDTYIVEGYIDSPVTIPGVHYSITVSGTEYPIERTPRAQRELAFMGDIYHDGGAFKAVIELPENAVLSVVISSPGSKVASNLNTGPFTRFGALKLTYRQDETMLLKRVSNAIHTYSYSPSKHFLLEGRLWLQILLNWRLRTAYGQLQKLLSRNLRQLSTKAKVFEVLKPVLIVGESIWMIPRAFILRGGYFIARRGKQQEIWLISDRGMAAGDNGEALFRYAIDQKNCPADVYFVLSKQSKDFERLKAIGPVLNHGSLAHKLKFLLADKVISSQADVETTNPFLRQMDHYVNLFNFDFVFLQHGVIRHDLSDWLNRYNKNIQLFITSAQKEYDSLFGNPYYYDMDAVLLSGLPRYDYLRNEPNRKLILAPTYRKYLAKQKTDKNGQRNYDPSFKQSEYREFYNNFMNDTRLREVLKKTGITGEFYLHPAFSAQHGDFNENEEFKVMGFPYDYKAAFREGVMLVSDHSSVVFDFAYLKKPVAYAHFDVDTFFRGHSYSRSSFFNDEDDGFGEVYYDYESLVQGVIETLEQGGDMNDDYKTRVDQFFYKVDDNNCQRVYDAITTL